MTTGEPARAARPAEPTATVVGRTVSTVASVTARLASWRAWLMSATAFGVFAGVLFGSSAPFAIARVEAACGQAPPDVRFTSSGDDVSGFLNACGVAGRDAYRSLQVADVFYPLVFGIFMASSLALVLTRLAPERRRLVAVAGLPLVGSAFDYLENVFAWLALAQFPEESATRSLLGVASAAKTMTFWAAGALLLGSLATLLIAEGRRRIRPRAHGAHTDATVEARS